MRVTLQPSGIQFTVGPEQTLLDAARSAGVELAHACRGGRCGLCAARLIVGAVSYPGGAPTAADFELVRPGEVLLCRAVANTDVVLDVRPVRAVGASGVKRLPARVATVERLGPDLARAWLKLPRAEAFDFRAGQYLDLLLGDGARRSYSIASPPHDATQLELHIRRGAPGGQGAALFESLAEGMLLEIEGPLGAFAYDEPDAAQARGPLLLVAGGTGFAPVKSILRHVLHVDAARRIEVYRGARHLQDLYDHAWLSELALSRPQLRYVPVLSDESSPGAGPMRAGLVHEALAADHADLRAAQVYAAGPPPMLEALAAAARARGLPAAQFHHDLPTA